ncbi:MAG: hypothetical protein ABIC40_03660 [bacterium]
MFFPRLIRRLTDFPAFYALGLLWCGEITVLLCSISGGYFLSRFLFEALKKNNESLLFPAALVTYFIVFYAIHWSFGFNSQLMESLIFIHRSGGIGRFLTLRKKSVIGIEKSPEDESQEEKEDEIDPLKPPERIRASAQVFKIRYFIVLPASLVLYLLGFVSTIYSIFTRQIETWDSKSLAFPALTAFVVGTVCFWLLMPHMPGYVSVRRLLGQKPHGGI